MAVIACVGTVAVAPCDPAPDPGDDTNAAESVSAAQMATGPRPFRITGDQIVTDTFVVRHDLRNGRLTVVLDTDLGDATRLMVSVRRSYWIDRDNREYSADYLSERSTVGAWRDAQTIALDHDAWEREIEWRQKTMAAAGEPFTVSRVADNIRVSFVVPVHQEPPFDSLNANLVGDVVVQNGKLRNVRYEASVPYPIDATMVNRTRFADPRGLVISTTYRTLGEVPLVPEIDPPDAIGAIGSMQQLSTGEEFTVLETTRRRDTPWYRVQTRLGEGWINSTALIGQEIVVVR